MSTAPNYVAQLQSNQRDVKVSARRACEELDAAIRELKRAKDECATLQGLDSGKTWDKLNSFQTQCQNKRNEIARLM